MQLIASTLLSVEPLIKHGQNMEIQPGYFPVWHALIRHTASDVFPPETAMAIAALADRIGPKPGFRITLFRNHADVPPELRGP